MHLTGGEPIQRYLAINNIIGMKKILITALLAVTTIHSFAQEVTYIHDQSKQAQFTVMELGTGSLVPQAYYSVVHGKYMKDASSTNKNMYRGTANTASLPQVEMSDSIKKYLETRAREEGLNMADRQVDAAWLVEGSKIENRLSAFKNNILALSGKTNSEEITSWTELGSMYDFAIKATRKAYMPNSEREKQYVAIFEEITKSNDALLLRVRYLATKNKIDRLVAAMYNFNHRVGENVTAGYNRWRDAATNGSGTNRVTTQ